MTTSGAGTGVAGESLAKTGAPTGVKGMVASAGGMAGRFVNTAAGDLLRGEVAGNVTKFRVDGTGTVHATAFKDASCTTMGGGLPAGTILPFAGNTPPPGYLLCDGALVNETQYPELFAAIGTAWCSGAGAGDFRVPDLRGRFMRGADDGANRDEIGVRTASNVGGSAIGVGSLQGDATRRPNNSFVTNVAGEHTHSAPTELGASGGGTFEIGFPGGAPSPT